MVSGGDGSRGHHRGLKFIKPLPKIIFHKSRHLPQIHQLNFLALWLKYNLGLWMWRSDLVPLLSPYLMEYLYHIISVVLPFFPVDWVHWPHRVKTPNPGSSLWRRFDPPHWQGTDIEQATPININKMKHLQISPFYLPRKKYFYRFV